MSEVKVFRVTGRILKPNLKTAFKKEVRALKPEDAKEKILVELGSKHRAKRFHIKISEVQEVPFDKIENPVLKKMALGEQSNVK